MPLIEEYDYSSIEEKSAFMTLVSINSTLSNLLYHFLILSMLCILIEGTKITIAEPEPLIPAALAPLTNASLVIFRPVGSFNAPITPRPFHVKATKSFPSCNAFNA